MADDPVENGLEYLEAALYDSQYGKGLHKSYLHAAIEEKDKILTHYHKQKEELAQVKSDNAFIKEALQASNLDADAYFEMSEKLASLRADKERAEAELAQVKEKRDRYQEALEWYVNNVDTGKVARQALENK